MCANVLRHCSIRWLGKGVWKFSQFVQICVITCILIENHIYRAAPRRKILRTETGQRAYAWIICANVSHTLHISLPSTCSTTTTRHPFLHPPGKNPPTSLLWRTFGSFNSVANSLCEKRAPCSAMCLAIFYTDVGRLLLHRFCYWAYHDVQICWIHRCYNTTCDLYSMPFNAFGIRPSRVYGNCMFMVVLYIFGFVSDRRLAGRLHPRGWKSDVGLEIITIYVQYPQWRANVPIWTELVV